MFNPSHTKFSLPIAAAAEAETKDHGLDSPLQAHSLPVKGILSVDEYTARYLPDMAHINQLQSSASSAAKNLQTAVNSNCELQDLLDKDRHAAGQFAAELLNWNRVMTQLEKHAKTWPNFPAPGRETKAPADTASGGVSAEDLLHALTRQEDKIRALQSQLQNLEQQQNTAPQPATDPYVNRLIVMDNGNETLKFPLFKNFITIGRNPQNDIQLRTSHVSRFHARIVSDADSAYIEDLNSANGIMVNSSQANRQKLRSGDLVVIGRVQLKYIDLTEGSPDEGQA